MLRPALAMLALPLVAALAGAPPPPMIAPRRTSAPPRIDGRLDDAAWATAPSFTGFVQKAPVAGGAPVEPTTVRVLYDDQAIYLAIDCAQVRVPLTARLTRRDRVVEADRVVVYLDTMHDHKSAYHFEVNAAGVQADALAFADTDESFAWDEVWDAAVDRRADGWSAELAIPLRLLRFAPGASQRWGFQVRRFTAATQEEDELAYIAPDQGGEVSRYGELGPLLALQRPLGLELVPFARVLASHRQADAGLAPRGTDASLAVGLDGRWRITPAVSLDFAAFPDFGQVEADQVVLNLSSYETLYPEKRPFFLAGLDLFATPVSVLYTRRIGAAPPPPALAAGEVLTADPEPARIAGAAKLTGRAGPLSFAALSAVTLPGTVVARASDGREREVELAPTTLYDAGRVRLDLGDEASLGAIMTATARPGGGRDSAIAGLDAAWRSPAGDWAASGQVLASVSHGGASVRFADGAVVRSGDASAAGVVRLAREGGRVIGEVDCDLDGRHFDPGDLGYVERQDLFHCFESIGWHDTRLGRWVEEQQHHLEVFHRLNLAGQPLESGYQLNTSGRLRSAWRYFSELHLRPAHLDDRELGDGTALERAGLVGWELSLHSDARRALSFDLGTSLQRLSDGAHVAVDGALALRPHPQLELELLPALEIATGEPRYVGEAGEAHLFAREDALAVSGTVRATFTFSPRLTLQAYGQLFVDRLRFSGFATAAPGDREIHLAELVPAAAPAESPDVADGALAASLVARWEIRPGSTAYLVVSHAQARAAPLGDGGGLPALATLRAPAADLILLKLSWWFG